MYRINNTLFTENYRELSAYIQDKSGKYVYSYRGLTYEYYFNSTDIQDLLNRLSKDKTTYIILNTGETIIYKGL